MGKVVVSFLSTRVSNNRNNDRESINSLNDFLKDVNVTMLAIRGNHDNPIFFNGDYDFIGIIDGLPKQEREEYLITRALQASLSDAGVQSLVA